MRLKFFLYIFFSFVLIHSQNVESRELSIKQLEERKKLDLERKKELRREAKKLSKRNHYNYRNSFFIKRKRSSSCII